jgi:hypothetical protein
MVHSVGIIEELPARRNYSKKKDTWYRAGGYAEAGIIKERANA